MALSRAGARHRRALVLAAGLALFGLALDGCQSNPEPPPLDRTATSTSPAPSPTASAPTLPPEAKGTSEAAAKAFVRHWIDVLNYAGPTADTAALREISDTACAACTAIADFIDQVHSRGGDISGRGWDVETIKVVSGTSGQRAVVDAQVRVNPQEVRLDDHSRVKKFAGGIRLKTFWLSISSDSWAVTRLDQPR